MYCVLPTVLGGGNMVVTSLLRTFQLLAKQGECPSTIYLQVDGGSENWCVVLFAMLDLLFDIYPSLNKVIVSRLAVGHTHIDIDRFFSYLNAMLFNTSQGGRQSGTDVLTREAFKTWFYKAMATKKDTMLLSHVFEDLNFSFDFWKYLEPHLFSGVSGYGASGNVHVFKYERRQKGSPPHISYKTWHQSPQ